MPGLKRKTKRLVPRQLLHRLASRMRRTVKRRMKGESRRQWIERNLHDSEAGIILDVVQCTFSLAMVISVVEQNWTKSSVTIGTSNLVIDTINLVATLVNISLRFYSASNRRSFMLHWLSLVEMACVLPLVVEFLSLLLNTEPQKYIFRMLLMVRAGRLLQFYRLLRLAKSTKFRQALLIGLTTLSIIICAAVFMQTIEYCDPDYPGTLIVQVEGQNCQDLSFLDSIYFICVTISTVGFGDLAPKSSIGKAFDVALILFASVIIPLQLSGYTYILSRETAFDKKYVADKGTQHVLLCGEVENGALLFFLHNWLHKDEERRTRRKVIILAPTLPSSNLRRVLLHPDYEERVVYLQGSAMVAADLQRAAAPSAEYCFVMVKKHSEALDQNDTAANLITCSVRKNNRHAPLHVQVSKFDNTRHFQISGATAVICLEQLKLAFFGKCLWIRGLNPFLGNLFQKFGAAEESRGYWLSDYLTGCSHRICEASIPTFLLHMSTYRALAVLIYREFGVPVVGLRTVEDTAIVYPVDQILGDGNFHGIFFLARSNDVALKIEKLTPAVFSRHPDISPALSNNNSHAARTVTSILNVMEQKMLFRRMSVAFGQEQYPSPPAHETLQHVNTRSRIPSASIGFGIFTNRSLDKISPIDSDSDNGEQALAHKNREEVDKEPAEPKHFVGSPREQAQQPADSQHFSLGDKCPTANSKPPKTLIPVIALSPAELIKKVNSAQARTPRDPVMKPLSSRTPRSSRERSVEEAPRTYSAGRASNGTTDPGLGNIKRTTVLERPAAGDKKLPDRIAPGRPSTNALATQQCIDEEDESRSVPRKSWAPASLNQQRTSMIISGNNLRTRIRHLSLCFRREPPPSTLIDHFVVCGTPSNYADFLANLSDLDEKLPGIVFVTPRNLTEKDVQAHQLHDNLYFVRGSPLSMHVFHTARMFHARSILIMSYCGVEYDREQESEVEMESLDENMADVDAITTHRFISEALQNELSREENRIANTGPPAIPFLVAEMIRPSNVKFLIDRSGSLYNEKALINEARQRELLKDLKYLDASLFSPLYTSGHIYFSNFSDALMGSCSNQELLIEMVTQLIISGNMSMQLQNRDARSRNRLTQIPAPTRYHFRPYALLVEGLLHNEDTMTLGIYRNSNSRTAPSFVFTNPPPDEIVTPQDLLFVIK